MTYEELVNSMTPKENKWKNLITAFISGGVIGALSEVIASQTSVDCMLIVWIFISSIITGFGVMDEIVDKFKMGVIIPITGFAHSITAASIEYKREGLVTGIGSNYFKLAGSVILYGIVASAVFATLRGLLW